MKRTNERRQQMKLKWSVGSMLVALLLVNSPLTHAQDAPAEPFQWDRLAVIAPEEKLAVKLKDGKSVEGRFLSASDTTLTVRRKGRNVDIARDSVQRVFRVIPRKAAKSLLTGTGVGAGIGVAIGAILAARWEAETGEEAFPIILLGSLGTGIGAAVGGLHGMFKRQQKVLVFEAK